MLFGKKKSKDKAAAPATIRDALKEESAAADQAEDASAETAEDVAAAEQAETKGENKSASFSADAPRVEGHDPEDSAADSAEEETSSGPYDVSEIESRKGYIDFGSVMIPGGKDQKVRLDIDQKTKRVVALTISVGQASVQLQPFSAPKSGGTWDEVRQQIQESVVKQKGKVKEAEGRFGKELVARVPTTLKDGRSGWRVARFIGFEGNRWFLRGVVGGRGAIDRSAAQEVEDLFSRIVVVRGDDPMPPRELLQLRPPEGAKRVTVPRNPAQRRTGESPNPAAADVSASGAAEQ